MSDAPHEVVDFDPAKLDLAAEMLARAFDADPVTRYLLPDPRRRAANGPWMQRACLRFALGAGRVLTTPTCAGVSVWLPPGKVSMGLWQAMRCGMLAAPFRLGLRTCGRLFHLMRLGDRLHKRALPEPHWYLFLLAVDPAQQRRGVGGALLASGLARAEADRLPVYLETTTADNVRYYEQHGFEVAFHEALGGAPVSFWGMIRKG